MRSTDLQKEKWLYGNRFVYSITYDEGFVDLLEHTLPVHDRFSIPGQLGMVAGQVGMPRNVEGSSWNGKLHMDVSQIRECLDRGWGVSSHSMTHGAQRSMYADPHAEVVGSRERLEQLLDMPITSFIVPYDNDNHPPVKQVAKDNGYLSVYTLTDDVNSHDTDLYALHRSPLVEEGFYPFYSRLDPYLRLHQAREQRGWVVDYTHLSNPEVVAPTKEVSQAGLERRFEKVIEVGNSQVWTANCDEVVDYILLSRGATLETRSDDAGTDAWVVKLDVSPRVLRRLMSFSLPAEELKSKSLWTDPSRPLLASCERDGRFIFTLEIEDGLRIGLEERRM